MSLSARSVAEGVSKGAAAVDYAPFDTSHDLAVMDHSGSTGQDKPPLF